MNKNEIDKEVFDKPQQEYIFKEEPIQLISISDCMIKLKEEGINLLKALTDQNLSILSLNGPLSSGKSSLANTIINKTSSGFKTGEKTQGIWIWGKPIDLKDGIKLLLLDCQGLNKDESESISNKLFILSVLLSTSIIYNTQGELNDNTINDFVYYTDLSNKIKVHSDNNNKLNNINNLKEYFPELIFINNTLSKENIQDLIEKNPSCGSIVELFEKRVYINSQNIQELSEKIKDMKCKSIDKNIIDGDSFLGLILNYIDFINQGENPVIFSALENVLLSKAKKISESMLNEFKINFNKNIKYPMSISEIYQIFFELQQKFVKEFCKKISKNLTPIQTGDFIYKMSKDMEKELENALLANKDHYNKWFNMEYSKLDQELSKLNLESIEQIKPFILSYTSNFKNCINDFLKISNSDFYTNLIINVLSKIFQNLICDKLKSIGDKLCELYENFSKECNNKTNNLNNDIKKLNEEEGKEKSSTSSEQSENFQILSKNIHNTFLEFKENIHKLNKENENALMEKDLENSSKEIEDNLKNCVKDLRTFCDNQIKNMNNNYEKEIKKIKDKYEELHFEFIKKNTEVLEKNEQKEVCETKLKEFDKKINELTELSNSKDNLIKTQNEAIKMYSDRINDYIKSKENLEMSLAKSIYDFKMKEDEFDSLFMVLEGIISKKKDKYEHNLSKLSSDVKNNLQALIKQYKFFK